MATDFEKVEAETKTSENVTLDSEAQQSREAGKQLAEEGGGNSDLLAVARSMEQAARKQKNLTLELRQTTKAVADALKEIEAIVAHILCHVVPSFLPPGRAYWAAVSLPSYPWHLLSRQPHSLHDAGYDCCQRGNEKRPRSEDRGRRQ